MNNKRENNGVGLNDKCENDRAGVVMNNNFYTVFIVNFILIKKIKESNVKSKVSLFPLKKNTSKYVCKSQASCASAIYNCNCNLQSVIRKM